MTYSAKDYGKVYKDSSANEGILNILIFRRISIYVVKICVYLRVTPNMLTYVGLALNILAAILFFTAVYKLQLIGLIPFLVAKVLDCADGQLARLTKQTSKFGAFIDPFIDRISDILILASLSYASYVINDSYVAASLYAVLVSLWFISAYLAKENNITATGVLKNANSKLPNYLRNIARWDGGFTALIFCVAVIFNLVPELLLLNILVTIPPVIIQFISIYKRYNNDQT